MAAGEARRGGQAGGFLAYSPITHPVRLRRDTSLPEPMLGTGKWELLAATLESNSFSAESVAAAAPW